MTVLSVCDTFGNQFFYREHGTDLAIINEVLKVYGSVKCLDETVLDLGAHIGAASRLFLYNGAKRIISVEPERENFSILQKNTAEFDRILPIESAVSSIPAPVSLWLHPSGNSAMHRTQKRRGRVEVPVSVVSLENLLTRFSPGVIKCDIEYGEYALPELFHLPVYVHTVAIEIHGVMYYSIDSNPKTELENSKMHALYDSFIQQGFSPTWKKEKKARGSVFAICATFERPV
jgi:FkbM family methyltransferase